MFEILSICKGGGYRYARTRPAHPNANAMGLYPLHRVLMENHLGRLLRPNEVVHHKDEDKANDSIENLELVTRAEHSRHHARTVEEVLLTCPVCRCDFSLKPHRYRARMQQSKSGLLGCSRKCGRKIAGAG